ncbi:MAG: PKD domain-containing protein, partial [Thermoplasmata archaeon]|nr:PKD domain-containing protein [Thermoplasmata archaeon]
MTSVIAIVVVLVLVGVGTFAVMGGFAKSGAITTCQPANSPVCGQFVNLHDLNLLIPFRSIQQGAPVPFTASAPSGESVSSYTYSWGDGTSTNNTHNQTVRHAFLTSGTFIIEVHAVVNGLTHDNVQALQVVQVTPSYQAASGGELPTVVGQIISNTTTPAATRGATAVLSQSQSVTVAGTYTSAPSNPLFLTQKPSIIISPSTGATISSTNPTNSSAIGVAQFTAAGTYTLTFVGSASNGVLTAYQNYTWTAFVAPQGIHAGLAVHLTAKSPHAGTIINYELAPGGSFTEDPAIDYETLGAEPILNVYQTLITY